ncbi:capsid assembly protein [Dyella silvatica]|uniref:capsid assembly protein n=1 Tax=Dyella silvatica TaxID=2992128 RepID=UPI00225A11C3|nr:hypothetical protein [Dyella silvatica]
MSEQSQINLSTDPAPPASSEQAPVTSTESTFGGFQTVEELVAAHEALKAEKASPPAEPAQVSKEIPSGDETAQGAVAKAGLDWNALNEEFATSGALSEATYESLEKSGIPKAEVDTYIRGKQAEVAAYDNAVFSAVGGATEYTALIEWAKNGYNDAEKKAFNDAVRSGDAARAALAVEALAARRAATRGSPPPGLLKGGSAATGVTGYPSTAAMQADMRNPQYKTDPAFRAMVVERLRLTDM